MYPRRQDLDVREFAFELRLCARLEAEGALLARQLGAAVARPGNRVADVVVVEPGPAFDARRAITPAEIPDLAIEADVGPGRARSVGQAFEELDVHPETAREVAERAVEVGFFERERRGSRAAYRQATRYPDDWFDRLVAIENKPDLASPGDMESQLRRDVALGLVDEVVLATGSYVTRAHLNRLPEAVGVWRFRDDEVEIVREATPLDVAAPGVEVVEERPGRTEIRTVGADAKARARRRIAERAYGKGWRTYDLPGCSRGDVVDHDGVGGLPSCGYHGRLVNPAADCGPACPGYDPAEPPEVDQFAERDRTSPWRADPPGAVRRQTGLDGFG